MTLIYECSDGTRFNLMSSPIFAQNPEVMAASDWKYSVAAAPGVKPRVKKTYRSTKDHSLVLAIFADSAEEFNATMEELHGAFEKDIRAGVPGKLWWDSYYKPVYITAVEHADFDELFEYVEETVTVTAVSQYWYSPGKMEYRAAEITDTEAWLDYEFDYEFDYRKAQTNVTFKSDSMFESDFVLTFYGPCQNPSVSINGALYALELSLTSGERATIDSLNQKIRKTTAKGVEENAFRSWTDKENYIFKKLPVGQIEISWSKLFDFDLVVYAERNTPVWI